MGKVYRNATQVSQYSGSDGISDFYYGLSCRLKKSKESGNVWNCYVNPENPEEVVLTREFRVYIVLFFAMFAMTFGLGGIGIILLAFYVLNSDRRDKRFKKLYSEEPWRRRKAWRANKIKSNSGKKIIFFVFFAAIWNSISFPLSIIFLSKEETPIFVKCLVVLFPAVGICLIIALLIMILRRMKFGESYFIMDSVPGVLGGKLSGEVCIERGIPENSRFTVRLRCEQSSSSDDRSSVVLWEDECLVDSRVLNRAGRSRIPVVFALPYDLPQSEVSEINAKIIWKLKVSSGMLAINYSAEFEVPVFRTKQSSSDYLLPEEEFSGSSIKQQSTEEILESAGIQVGISYSGGRSYILPILRNKGEGGSMLIIMLIWIAGGFFLHHFHAPQIILTVILFSGIPILLYSIYSWFNSRTIEIDKYQLKIAAAVMGISKKREIDIKDIKKISMKISLQSNDITFYKIILRTNDNKRYTIASGLKGKMLTKAFIKDIKKFCDLPQGIIENLPGKSEKSLQSNVKD
jgi:hypothetical protein